MRMRKLAIAVLAVFALPLLAQVEPNPADYERVLVPLTTQTVHGQQGSLWSTTLRIFNGTFEPLEMIGPTSEISLVVDPQQTESESIAPLGRGLEGAFLYVPKARLATTKFSLRVANHAKGSILGNEIPVVRESEAKPDLAFIDIPDNSRYRIALRIYGWTEAPMQVGVRVFREDGPTIDEQYTVDLSGIVHVNPEPFPLHPSYGVINPLPRPLPFQPGNFPMMRVEVTNFHEIVSPPPPFIWGFISITDNVTGEVTIVEPQ